MLREEEWYGRTEGVLEEIMGDKLPKSIKTINSQIQEGPWASRTGNMKMTHYSVLMFSFTITLFLRVVHSG